MEEIYLIEFFINKINLQCKSKSRRPNDEKKLTVNIDFGRFASFVIQQTEFDNDMTISPGGEFIDDADYKPPGSVSVMSVLDLVLDDVAPIESVINGGASLLFSHNPLSLKQTFKLFPLEISVWTNDESEKRACVGITKIMWDYEFIELAVKSAKTCGNLPPVTLKFVKKLTSEVNGSIIGEIIILIRMTALGKSVVTRFREVNKGNAFIFRNKMLDASYKCKKYGVRTKSDQLNPVGIIYESMNIKDPDDVKAEDRKKRASDELKAAGLDEGCVMFITGDQNRQYKPQTEHPLPCGNANCKLTQMIKSYLVQEQPTCKTKDDGKNHPAVSGKMTNDGCCDCKYLQFPEDPKTDCGPNDLEQMKDFKICEICGGISRTGKTCKTEQEDGGQGCPRSCGTNKEDRKQSERNMQRMLYEGLTRMLAGRANWKLNGCANTPRGAHVGINPGNN